MVNHKLQITPSLNGYEFLVKDVTGFGPGGYSNETLNVNNVHKVLLVLKNSYGKTITKLLLEGSEKNDFMSGLSEVSLLSSDNLGHLPHFKVDEYTVEAYLITKQIAVRGVANHSSITGTDLDSALQDNFVVDEDIVYGVVDSYTNGGTILQLDQRILRFFSIGGFGYQFSHAVNNYVKALKTIFRLSQMRVGALQKDGESENYNTLVGYINAVQWNEALEVLDSTSLILRSAEVLSSYFDNKYFRV